MKKEITIAIESVIKIKNWMTFFRIHSGNLRKGFHKITLRNGIAFFIRGNIFDAGIIREVAIQDYYHLNEISKNDVVVDIGGALGIFSVMAASKASKVFSYEPFPDNFEIIKKNIMLNHIKNIKPFKLAVYSKVGKVKIFTEKDNLGGHSIYGKTDNFILIKTTTLKRIFDENKLKCINFLKMDCEGSEYDILFKTPKKYLKRIYKIVMEYHKVEKHDIKELKYFLIKNNFDIKIDRFMLYANNRNFKSVIPSISHHQSTDWGETPSF